MNFLADVLVFIGATAFAAGMDFVISTAGQPSTLRAPLGIIISVLASALMAAGMLIHRRRARGGGLRFTDVMVFVGTILLVGGTDLVIVAPTTMTAPVGLKVSVLGVALIAAGIMIERRRFHPEASRSADVLVFVGAIMLVAGTDLVISTAGVSMMRTVGGPLGVIGSATGTALATTGILMHRRRLIPTSA
jgi:hypothetical protein